MKKIIGLGNSLADILTPIPSDEILRTLSFGRGSMNLVDRNVHHRIAELTESLESTIVSGGSAANTLRGLGRLTGDCSYIGKIGRDRLGDFMETEMIGMGVRPQLIKGNTPTGRCMVLISPDGERTMATYLGAAVELTAQEVSSGMFTGYDLLHIEGYLVQDHRLIYGAVRKAKDSGLKISLDMASYNVVEENREFLRTLMEEFVDLAFANEDEARALTGKDPEEAVKILGRWSEIAVVKTGENGSLISSGDERYRIKAVPARVVDTTGAGDLYATGFLYGWSLGMSLGTCGDIGSFIAAKTIANLGPTYNENDLDEIRKFIATLETA